MILNEVIMIGHQEYQPKLFSTVDIESLIPKNHQLRKIDKAIDFSFIRELTSHLYCADNGRPSVDPILFFRIYLIIFLYGIDSDRQACEEIQYNLAYRWFCRLALEDTVPDHSSLSKIRDRLGEETFKKIFDQIIEICIEKNLVTGSKVMMDGSIIKADAALRSIVDRPKDGENLKDIVPPKYIKDRKLGNKHQISKTDPESTLAGKKGEPKKLAFKVHDTIDRESRIIIDTHVTTGADLEGNVMMERIDYIENNFNLKIEELTADRGYGYGKNQHELNKRKIQGFVPRFHSDAGDRFKRDSEGFTFNKEGDYFICPVGNQLHPIEGSTPDYKRYRIKGGLCRKCPLKEACLTLPTMKTRNAKHIEMSIYHEAIEQAAKMEQTDEFKKVRAERQWKMEGVFAEAKDNHGLARARYRGRMKMQIQSYMVAIIQNLKRIANNLILILKIIYFEMMKIFKKINLEKTLADFLDQPIKV